jgi:hypothetical protein
LTAEPYYPLSPVERPCPDCLGTGRILDRLCARCDGICRVFIEGGPSFGCRMTLEDAKLGQIVTLGNNDRGRVVRHSARGTPTTEIALIDPMFDEESPTTTTYPSATGVISMSIGSWFHDEDQKGLRASREDPMDPLRKRIEGA